MHCRRPPGRRCVVLVSASTEKQSRIQIQYKDSREKRGAGKMGRWKPTLLGRHKGQAESKSGITTVGEIGPARCRTAPPRIIHPTSSAGRPGRLRENLQRIRAIGEGESDLGQHPVPAPFPDIAMHVKEAPFVRRIFSSVLTLTFS